MRALRMFVLGLAVALTYPGIAVAQEALAAGAAAGALTGGLLGGPLGAVIGGLAGAAAGDAAEARDAPADPVLVAPRRPARAVRVVERTCVRDRAGNETCRERLR